MKGFLKDLAVMLVTAFVFLATAVLVIVIACSIANS